MESINSEYKCYKCKKKIISYNKLLHDANCEVLFDREFNHNNEKVNINNITGGIENIERINLDLDDRCLPRGLPRKIYDDLYKLCTLCDVYLNENEYEDHVMCHILEKELEISNVDNRNQLPSANHSSHIIMTKENINISKSPCPQNKDEIVHDFDLIEDKEEILKEIEEDENFKKKFEEKKNASPKKSYDVIVKNTISYLFDYKYRRVPPVVRILGAIFDSRQLIRLAEDEIGARLATRIVEGPQSNSSTDQEILLSLIPEINLQDVNHLPFDKRDCVICGDRYEKDQKISNLPCLHTFHSSCIKEWFKQKNLCPICKYEITKENFN